MAGPASVVAIDVTVNPRNAVAGFKQIEDASERTAKISTQHFEKATSSIGTTFAKLDQQLASFGVPFAGALTAVGGSLDKATKSGQGLHSAISAIGGATLLAAGAGLAIIGTASVKAALDFEAAHARLVEVANDTGGGFATYADKIGAADKQLEQFGFTNTDSENAMSRLTVATRDVGKTTELMGLAADIARARNLSLQDATDILTRAEAGRFLQLTRLGIVSKETAATFRNSADAIAYLTAAYGGQASAFADTYAGKLAKLHATVTDLSVGIGEALIPVLEGLASTAVDTINSFQDVNSVTGGMLGKILLLGSAVPAAVFVVDKLALAGAAVGRAFERAGSGFSTSTAAVVGAVDAETTAIAANIAAKGEVISADAVISAMNEKRVGEILATQEAEALQAQTRIAASGLASAAAAAVVAADGEVVIAEGLVTDAIAARIAAEEALDVEVQVSSAQVVAAEAAVVAAYGEEAVAATLAAEANAQLAAAKETAAATSTGAGLGGVISGITAGVITIGGAIVALHAANKAADSVGISFGNVEQHRFDTVTSSIEKLGRAGQDTGLIADTFGTHWEKVKSALDSVGDQSTADKFGKVVDHFNTILGGNSGTSGENLASDKAVKTIDKSLADMTRTGGEAGGVAQATFEQIYAHAIQAHVGVDTLKKSFNDYYAAVKESGDANTENLAQGRLVVAKQQFQDLLNQPKQLAGTPEAAAQDEALAKARTAVVIASRDVVGVQPEVTAAVQEGADGSDAAATAAFQQSDALKDLKSSLVQLDYAGVVEATGRLNDAVLTNVKVEQQADDAMAHAKARADDLTGGIISLADAYIYLGNQGSKDAVTSFDALNQAAFEQYDANAKAAGSVDDLNKALNDLNTDSSNGNKTAAAAAIERRTKELALRDALLAVADQEGKIQDAQRAVADAQRGLSDARRDQREKLLALADAERQYEGVMHGVARSTKEAQDAEENLTKARLDARSRALDAKDAEQALRDAKANVIDVSQFGDPREVADAKEKVQRAQIALEEAGLARHDSINAQTEAQRIYNGTLYGFALGSKEATDAQKLLTDAQHASLEANLQVDAATRQITTSMMGLRDANNQTAVAALGLVHAQADIDGALEKTDKKLDDHQKKIDDVKAKAVAASQTIGAAFAAASKSTATGIEYQIQYLRDLVAKYPVLRGAFDQVLANLQEELKHAPTGPPPGAAPLDPNAFGTGPGGETTTADIARINAEADPNFPASQISDQDKVTLAFLGLRQFAEGGFVPGAPGTPVQLVAHGGEYIVSAAELQGDPRPDSPFHDLLVPTAPQTATTQAASATPSTLRGGATPGPTQLPAAFAAAGSGLVTSFSAGLKDQWAKTVEPFFAGMHRAVLGHFDGARDWLRQPGTDIMAGFNQALVIGWGPINAFFDQLPNELRVKVAGAVGAAGESWQGIKGAFAVPVIWSITNVLNPLVGDVDAIAAALGMKPIMSLIPPIKGFREGGIVERDQFAHVHAGEGVIPAAAMTNLTTEQFENLRAGSSPVRGYATGGTVDTDQVAQLHAGEGVLPKAAMLTLSPQEFEALRVGARLEDIFTRSQATDKALGGTPIGGLIGGIDKAVSSDVAQYLQDIPDPRAVAGVGVGGAPGAVGTGIYRYTGDQATEFLDAIILHESGGNPKAMNPYGETRNGVFLGASGLFQFLHDTWNHYGGYEWAALAPVDVQWNRARSEVASFINQYGAKDPRLWSVGWYGGVGIMEQIMRGQKSYGDRPGGPGNPLTYGQFADWIVAHMAQFGADRAPAPQLGGGVQPRQGGSPQSLRDAAGHPNSYHAIESFMAASGVPYHINSDVRPGSITAGGTLSLHSPGRAVDFGGPSLINIWKVWEAVKDTPLAELFYSGAPTFIDKYGEHPVSMMDAADRANHYSHVHVGLEEGGVTDFPKAGASATLHGRELVAPLPPNFDLAATLRRNTGGSESTTVVKNYTIHVQSLDPRVARTVVLDALKEVERTDGFVPIRVGSG